MVDKIYEEIEVNKMSPLVWAYIGDSVFEMYIRGKMIEKGIPNNTKLHKNTTMYVKASAQSKMIEKLKEILSEEEIAIVKRARNADSNTIPKNSSVIEYKNATSLEGLLGYLFLTGKKDRLLYILDYVYNNFDTNEK